MIPIEEGPQVPPWWTAKKTVPEKCVASLWSEEFVVAVGLSWELLEHWAVYMEGWNRLEIPTKGPGNQGFVSAVNGLMERGGLPVRIRENNDRVEKDVTRRMWKVRSELKKAGGGHKRKLMRERVVKLHLTAHDLVSAHELAAQKSNLDEKAIEEKAESLLVDMKEELAQERQKVSTLEAVNQDLQQAIEKRIYEEEVRVSKTLGESAQRSARMKIKTLKSRGQLALSFARKLGVEVDSLLLRDVESGEVSQLSLADDYTSVTVPGMRTATQQYVTKTAPHAVVDAPRLEARLEQRSEPSGKNENFRKLPEANKDQVYRLLHLLDRFCVSDEAYHEVTMNEDGALLPRSYILKQARHDLNELVKVEVVNAGDVSGVHVSFVDMLRAEIELYNKEHKISVPEKIKVKVGGDGAEMTRNSSYQMFSFSLLNRGRSVLQPEAVRTVAVVCGQETYHTLKVGMANVFEEVNSLIRAKKIEVDGKIVPLEFYLVGDVKYKQRLLGFMSSTSNYACTDCRVHKHKRWDTDFAQDYYVSNSMRGDLEKDWVEQEYCHRSKPLLDIDLDNVVIDELHLLLRITDVLISNLVAEAEELDIEAGGSGGPGGANMGELVKMIRSCGVSFDVWASKEKGKNIAHTSLMGSDKLKLLKELPKKLSNILHTETAQGVTWLWSEFYHLFLFLSSWNPDSKFIDAFHQRAKQWLRNFLKLGNKRPGYGRDHVTPYMHSLVFHIHVQLRRHGSLKLFSCQAIEKYNDFARKVVHRRSNKKDAMRDVLLVAERQALLSPYARTARSYNRANAPNQVEGDDGLFCLSDCEVEWPVELDVREQTMDDAAASAAENEEVRAALEEAQNDPVTALNAVKVSKGKRRAGQSGKQTKRRR